MVGWTTTPRCDCGVEHYGANPARPNMGDGPPGWVRCWKCGGLWDASGNDVIAPYLERGVDLRLPPDELRK